ncbi:MAG: hypothetical protein L0177_06785 [Chloroflexi bacterium]|nr:hypothetical protein [Chloroflexota bacterium]
MVATLEKPRAIAGSRTKGTRQIKAEVSSRPQWQQEVALIMGYDTRAV